MLLSYMDIIISGDTYIRSITIDRTKCGSADQTDFTLLVSINDNTLKTVASGGHVYRSDGFDIGFYSDSGCTTQLNWEIEKYNGVDGKLIAWVKIPTVNGSSNSTNTIFYMEYGSTAITTFQGGGIGSAWDSNFTMVQHFTTGTTLSANDSSVNGNNGIISGASATTGIINGAASFDGVSNSITCGYTNLPSGNTPFTITTWLYMPVVPTLNEVWPVVAWGLEVTNDAHGIMVYNSLGTTYLVFLLWDNDLTYTWSPVANTWYKIMVTYDGTTAAIYLNGTQVASGARSIMTTPTNVDIGYFTGLIADYYSPINIDEVTISYNCRSGDWIITEYNNQNAPGDIDLADFLIFGSE